MGETIERQLYNAKDVKGRKQASPSPLKPRGNTSTYNVLTGKDTEYPEEAKTMVKILPPQTTTIK